MGGDGTNMETFRTVELKFFVCLNWFNLLENANKSGPIVQQPSLKPSFDNIE
jgi:hypothetical protein